MYPQKWWALENVTSGFKDGYLEMLFYKVGPGSSYKWSCTPYKWPSKWVTGVITLLTLVITPLITGRCPPCISISQTVSQFPCHYNCYPLALRPYQLYHVSCLLNYKCFTGKREGLGYIRIPKNYISIYQAPLMVFWHFLQLMHICRHWWKRLDFTRQMRHNSTSAKNHLDLWFWFL